MTSKYLFGDLVEKKGGFLRGPFGGDLKKEIFVPKGDDTYKVYEQGVVLNSNKNIGRYYISHEDFENRLKRFSVESGDFLVSCSGVNMGAIYQLKAPFEPGIINQALLRIRINKNIADENYFFYLFKELISKKITTGSGDSTIPNFPGLGVVKNIEVDLPDLGVQKKVGDFLRLIDEKIEINSEICKKLDEFIKLIYSYWFLQFNFPDDTGNPYRQSRGGMRWSEELKLEIPVGWGVSKLSDLIENYKNGEWGSDIPSESDGTRVQCIRGADINGINGLDSCSPPTRYIASRNSQKILNPYDLVIEISGGSPSQSTGRIAYITPTVLERFSSPVVCSNFCKGISLKDRNLFYVFGFYWDALYESGIFFDNEGKTSGIKNLLFDSVINSFYIPMPDNVTAKKFFAIADEMNHQKQELLYQNDRLVDLRDWILPMLLTQQCRII